MKLCCTCHAVERLSYSFLCRECHNAAQREHYKRHPETRQRTPEKNKEYRDKYSKQVRKVIREGKNRPCSDCGMQYPWYVMDYDHVRGEKKFTIAQMCQRQGIKTIKEEIAKCDVVCSNCHRERTHNRTGIGN